MERSGASRSARIAELLRHDASMSNNTIADLLGGIDRNLVSAVRHKMEHDRSIHRWLWRGGGGRTWHAEDCWCGRGSPPVCETVRRKPWALITWEPPALTTTTRFYATRAEAVAAAPDDGEPYTLIDISAIRSRPHPPISELLYERPPLDVVYPTRVKDHFYGMPH